MIKNIWNFLQKYWPVIIGVILTCLLLWTLYGVYIQGRGWADWTGFGKYKTASTQDKTGKTTNTDYAYRTLWDLLELLVIPLVLITGALWWDK